MKNPAWLDWRTNKQHCNKGEEGQKGEDEDHDETDERSE
jgi:hypothetical protein